MKRDLAPFSYRISYSSKLKKYHHKNKTMLNKHARKQQFYLTSHAKLLQKKIKTIYFKIPGNR